MWCTLPHQFLSSYMRNYNPAIAARRQSGAKTGENRVRHVALANMCGAHPLSLGKL